MILYKQKLLFLFVGILLIEHPKDWLHFSELKFDFDLHSKFNSSWDGNATTDRWILVQFMDTDCPYCWRDAELLTEIDKQFGGVLTTVVVASELNIGGHSSSRAEIAAFQDMTDYQGCYGGDRNCADRPGDPHQGLNGNKFYWCAQ